MKINYNRIYEIGIWECYIKNIDTKYWINQVYKIKSNDKLGIIKSNEKGYQTQDNLHNNPKFFSLFKNINHLFQKLFQNPDFKMTEMWANISKPQSFNWPHSHGNNIFLNEISGVLYLKVPSNSGDIVFHNPYDPSILLFQKTYVEKNIIFFPSHLLHSVLPNENNEDRISIAFNFKFDPQKFN